MMTEKGTFVINGTERVVVSQLVRSPGVIFQPGERFRLRNMAKHQLVTGTIHPYRGEWIEFDVEQKPGKDVTAGTKIARKRRLPIFTLLRALGYDEVNEPGFLQKFVNHFDFLEGQWEKVRLPEGWEEEIEFGDRQPPQEEALLEIYKRVRPGEPPSVEAARAYLRNAFFESRRYDLSRVGRYKLNRKLRSEIERCEELFGIELEKPDLDQRVLTRSEVLATCTYLLSLAMYEPGYRLDDQDHFANRRIRSVGELIQNQVRIGLTRMERVVRERMTTQDVESITPMTLWSTSARWSLRSRSSSAPASSRSSWTRPTRCPSLTHKPSPLRARPRRALPRPRRLRRARRALLATTGASARSRRPRVRTSASSVRSPPTDRST